MSVLELVATDINDYGFSGSINKFTLSIIAIRQIIFREIHFCIFCKFGIDVKGCKS